MLHIKYAGLLFITWHSQNTNCRKRPRMPATWEKLKRLHLAVCGTVHCISYEVSSNSPHWGLVFFLAENTSCETDFSVGFTRSYRTVLLRCKATQTEPCFYFYHVPCDFSSKLEMCGLSVIGIAVKAKAATTESFRLLLNMSHHHFRDRSRRRYDDSARSHTSMPRIPWLYTFTMCSCSTAVLCSFLTRLSVCWQVSQQNSGWQSWLDSYRSISHK